MSYDGVLIVNKPEGWTSHDVVNKARSIVGTRRVGHLGTLDPIATGVLPLLIGQATRLSQFLEKSEKAYYATVRLGFATSTYDRDGEPCGPARAPCGTAEQIELCLATMRGEISQTPPPVSAKKVRGVPAYKLVRKNLEVNLAPVRVFIYELSQEEFDGTTVKLRVRCSAGTYVRAIAHELGRQMSCGAHLEALVRTQSGPFRLDQAFTIEKLQELKDAGRLHEAVMDPATLLPEFPPVMVDDATVTQIRQGRDFAVSPFRVGAGAEHVKAVGPDGRLVAIGKIALPHVYHPLVVLS